MFGIVASAVHAVKAVATVVASVAKTVATAAVNGVAVLTSSATLELNFDPSQMFEYTNVITGSMMPLVYISAGFALGFTIIYALKNAFSGGVRL